MIVFARHAQTEVNRSGRLQGRTDPPLTSVGFAQAERLATFVAGLHPVTVRTSALRRAHDTASAIASRAGVAVEIDERLVELDYGTWDERAIDDISNAEWERWRADPTFAPPGGESLRAVSERMAAFCTDMLSDAVVVAVSHVSPVKAAVTWALGVDETAAWHMRLDLASVTRIAGSSRRASLVTFNETAHLSDRP